MRSLKAAKHAIISFSVFSMTGKRINVNCNKDGETDPQATEREGHDRLVYRETWS